MKIMDCTLRDGANVVGNGFSPELTKMMIEGLLRSNIRIIEMGNAKGLGATEKGSPAPISDVAYLDLIQLKFTICRNHERQLITAYNRCKA